MLKNPPKVSTKIHKKLNRKKNSFFVQKAEGLRHHKIFSFSISSSSFSTSTKLWDSGQRLREPSALRSAGLGVRIIASYSDAESGPALGV